MKRWFTALPPKPFVCLAVLTAAALASTTASDAARSKSARPETAELLAMFRASQPEPPGYQIQDGKVVDGSTPVAAEPGQQSAPGQVDTLNMQEAYSLAEQMGAKAKGKVFKDAITPHWFAENTCFWYRNDTRNGTKDFVLVNCVKGTREAAFDHEKLASALSKADGKDFESKSLPFDAIEFVDDGKAVLFAVATKNWQCDLTSYECKRSDRAPKVEPDLAIEDEGQIDFSQNSYDPAPSEELSPEEFAELQKAKQKKGQGKGGGQGMGVGPVEVKSPDGNWTAFIKDRNVWLRDKDGVETKATESGAQGNEFTGVTWSPKSTAVVAYRMTPGEISTVYLFESSPKGQLAAKMSQRLYTRPGDKFPTQEIWVIDVANKQAHKADVEPIDNKDHLSFNGAVQISYPRLRWNKEGTHFTFEKTDRGHLRFRIVEVEALTGKTRFIWDEKSETMINHASPGKGAGDADTFYLQYLDATGEIIYISELDGWRHLYLIDAKAGKIKNQITKGEWVVRKIIKKDEKNRQMWFTACGKNFNQDPYLIHYYRVNFDGTGLVALTEGDGNHSVVFSPDEKYIIDTYSRVDMAPVHEVRRVSDGVKVCDLEKADVSALEATGWRYPEVFVAKGRDGKTDIWGYIIRPQKLDPNKKYPVIENIYAGPHSSHVRKSFSATDGLAALAELGFIVVKIEGMGTLNRSRAFHDVCWKNLADAGFPDRILWMKALAKKYAYVDITRVGIYGTSAGGQNACGALLFHPEFYKVAVANCGCHDNRLDKVWWNESWMGLMGPHYESNSNITNAHKLQGRLLLIVGELDTNVPPESTYRVVDALIKAKKDFDFIAVPGANHGAASPITQRRTTDYFVQHLLGVTPPNHNVAGAGANGPMDE